MLLNLRNAMLGGKRLPYDAEVEYLESTGMQWLDTGYYPNGSSKIEMVAAVTSSPYSFMPLCFSGRVYNSTETFGFAYNKASKQLNFYFGNSPNMNVGGNTFSLGDPYKIVLYGISGGGIHTSNENLVTGVVNFNDRPGHQWQFTTSGRPLYLLYGNTTTTDLAKMTPAKLWSCKLFEQADLVMDLTPVRFTNEQGQSEGAMFDRVSGQLFRNAGTGAFGRGSDKTASNGGGYKRQCVRRSHRRSSRPHARFWRRSLWKEVA